MLKILFNKVCFLYSNYKKALDLSIVLFIIAIGMFSAYQYKVIELVQLHKAIRELPPELSSLFDLQGGLAEKIAFLLAAYFFVWVILISFIKQFPRIPNNEAVGFIAKFGLKIPGKFLRAIFYFALGFSIYASTVELRTGLSIALGSLLLFGMLGFFLKFKAESMSSVNFAHLYKNSNNLLLLFIVLTSVFFLISAFLWVQSSIEAITALRYIVDAISK